MATKFTNRNKDITGKKFGRLTVIRFTGKTKWEKRIWLCECECGNKIETYSHTLATGNTKSCGCLKRDTAGSQKRTHGLSRSKEYKSWSCIIQRCENPKNPDYHLYGGRGITICKRWRESFVRFLEDMGKCPKGNGSIDRIDGNKGYCPSNCQWATQKEQANNKRTNHLLTCFGRTQTIAQWSEESGFKYGMIRKRISELKWPPEKAVTVTPLKFWSRIKGAINA